MTIVLGAAALVFFLLGLRGVLQPNAAAQTFGLIVGAPEDNAFMQAVGARNIGMSLLALGLLIRDLRSALVQLLGAACLISGLDFLIVSGEAGFAKAAKHLVYLLALFGLAVWTLGTTKRH